MMWQSKHDLTTLLFTSGDLFYFIDTGVERPILEAATKRERGCLTRKYGILD